MRTSLWASVAAGVLLGAGAARADVTWEHTVKANWSLANRPLVQAKIYNSWTPQRHRVLLKYAVPNDPFEPRYNISGSAAAIRRLDDDRIIAYSSQEKAYISESRSAILEKMRVNVWSGWEAELAQETAPSFTPEQRARLGAELRATYQPFMREMARPYFRALPHKRVLNGIEASGYRMTWLLNTSGIPGNQNDWTRVSMEWWIAPRDESDEEIARFYDQSKLDLQKPGGLTNSIWLNETMPVLWASMPREVHQAVATLRPPTGAEKALVGVPVQMYLTVEPPKGGVDVGVLRAEVALTSRDTRTLAPSVWEAPAGYKRITGDNLNRQMQQTFQTPLVEQAMRQVIVASAGVTGMKQSTP